MIEVPTWTGAWLCGRRGARDWAVRAVAAAGRGPGGAL